MARLSIPYLTRRRNADGSFRYYWQPSRALAAEGYRLRRIHAADEFEAARLARAINDQLEAERAALFKPLESGPRPGTVGHLIAAYRASDLYQDRAKLTRYDYGLLLDWIDNGSATARSARSPPSGCARSTARFTARRRAPPTSA